MDVHSYDQVKQHKKLSIEEFNIDPKCSIHPHNFKELVCVNANDCDKTGDLLCILCERCDPHKNHKSELLLIFSSNSASLIACISSANIPRSNLVDGLNIPINDCSPIQRS